MFLRPSSLQPWPAGIAIVLIACGGASSPPAEDSEQADAKVPMNTERACELLTESDAEVALGSPIDDVSDESSVTPLGDKALGGRCFYKGDGGSVSLSVQKHIDAAYAGERFMRYRNRSDKDPSFRTLSGLGDDAFAEYERLHVKRGDLILIVELRYRGERKLKHYGDKPGLDALAADERKIAEQALLRLPPITKP
jgi:hypothetical protein